MADLGADAEPCSPEPMPEWLLRVGAEKTLLKPHITSILIPNQVFLLLAHSALREHQPMAISSKAKRPNGASKTSRPVTLKHLAATLAEEHQLTKRAGEALLGDL